MPLTGSMTENDNKTKNYSINGVKELDGGHVSAGLQVHGFRDTVDPKRVNAPPYNVAGASLGIGTNAGHSATVSGQHIPNFGDKVTASTNLNVMNTDKHKLDVHAFSNNTVPKAMPNFQTHGGGVDYAFKRDSVSDKFGANASVAHTPAFKTTDYSVGGRMNLHHTPTSSLDLNLGANRRDTAFGRGSWEKSGFIGFKKSF